LAVTDNKKHSNRHAAAVLEYPYFFIHINPENVSVDRL
jgi:hypothetical protein